MAERSRAAHVALQEAQQARHSPDGAPGNQRGIQGGRAQVSHPPHIATEPDVEGKRDHFRAARSPENALTDAPRPALDAQTVMALTVVCSVMEVPFICCFTPMQDDGVITRPAEYFHLFYRFVVDMIFVADIFVNFRTGYHKLGAVVMNKELIERHYLRHGFAQDVIAALPIICFPVTILFSILCKYGACPPEMVRYLFRYIRLLQLAKVRSALSQLTLILEKLSDQTSTLVTSLTELILFFVVLTHWFTCAWFLVQVYPINFQVQSEEHPAKHLTLHDSWLANNGENDPAVYASVDSFLAGSISFKETFILYINCFFWASSANDAYTTMNTSEKLVAILAQILIENGFMAFILASLISSLEEHSRGRKAHTMYRSKIDAVNDFMRHEGFPSDIIDNVREYYKVSTACSLICLLSQHQPTHHLSSLFSILCLVLSCSTCGCPSRLTLQRRIYTRSFPTICGPRSCP